MGAHISSRGFFKAPAQHGSQQGENYEVINVGGKQFQAIAVALIDYLHAGSPVNDATIKKILGCFSQYFPQYVANDAYLTTPKERMGRLLNNSRMSELVECMAYVLQQLTVDELYADHLNLNYRSVFANLSAQSYLRASNTKLPECALEALAHSLGLPITLSFKEPGKELRRRERYGDRDHAALVLQVQDEDYYPAVKRKADFTYVGQLAVTIKPAETLNVKDGNMADIFAAIASDNQRCLHVYEQQRHRILSMIDAGELTYEQLRAHYTALLPTQLHNAPFIMKLAHSEHPVVATGAVDTKQPIIELANKIASWIAAGAIKEDQLFENTPISSSFR